MMARLDIAAADHWQMPYRHPRLEFATMRDYLTLARGRAIIGLVTDKRRE